MASEWAVGDRVRAFLPNLYRTLTGPSQTAKSGGRSWVDEGGHERTRGVSAGEHIRWQGVALGWLVALPAGLLLGPLLRVVYDAMTGSVVTPEKFTSGLVIVSLVSGFLAYLFGGYAAGRFARRAGGLHGAITAMVGALAGTVLGAFGVIVSGGILVALIGLGFDDVTVPTALALFFAYLFGGYIGGKLGEPSQPAMRHPDD